EVIGRGVEPAVRTGCEFVAGTPVPVVYRSAEAAVVGGAMKHRRCGPGGRIMTRSAVSQVKIRCRDVPRPEADTEACTAARLEAVVPGAAVPVSVGAGWARPHQTVDAAGGTVPSLGHVLFHRGLRSDL